MDAYIVWLNVLSDASIALTYFIASASLFYFMVKRKNLVSAPVFILFGTFTLLRGLSHVVSVFIHWYPDYKLEGEIKAITAIVSIATLIIIIKLLRRALVLANPAVGLLASIVESSEDAIISKALDGTINSWNKGAERLFGYSEAEALGKPISILIPEDKKSEEELIIEQLSAGKPIKHEDTVRLHKNGNPIHVSLTVSPVFDSLGRIIGASKIAHDISERKEVEKTRDQMRHVQKMEALGQLTGGIAHDFNNLLAIIIGNLDFMYEKIPENDALRPYITPSIEAALHGSELTQRLLAFGRKQSLQPQILSLNTLLGHFETLIERTLGERMHIIMALEPELWNVDIDPGQLENALLNLSINARDAMPEGGKIIYETRNIILDDHYVAHNSEVAPGEYVMLAISDTGTGMTQEIAEKAFEPFFTTKKVGEGTGLGLSMVYGFVKQSNGHIKIYSEPQHGTSIKIYFPRVKNEEAHMTGGVIPYQPTPAQIKLQKILVVEDNKAVLNVTATMVRSLGYEVIESETGEAALDILKMHADIDLLLTDVMLPGAVNGPILASHALELKPTLKVLFNSGYAENAIFENGILQEGVHLLAKPFRKIQLAEKLSELLP